MSRSYTKVTDWKKWCYIKINQELLAGSGSDPDANNCDDSNGESGVISDNTISKDVLVIVVAIGDYVNVNSTKFPGHSSVLQSSNHSGL
jgi:hypothetical protein